MYKILAIANSEVVKGLRFSGINVLGVDTPELAKKSLLDVMKSKDYGIVIIDESLERTFDDYTKRLIEESGTPLFVPLPLQLIWQEIEVPPDDTYVVDMIRRAIGYQIKIR
ncbi:MAG: V-type ATP synthase subunit F [Candidatus Brocadiales bacterium]